MLEIQVKQPDIPPKSLKGDTSRRYQAFGIVTFIPHLSRGVIDPLQLVRPPRSTSLLAAWCAASVKGFYLSDLACIAPPRKS